MTGSIFGDTSSTSNNLKVQGLTFRGGGGLDSVFEEEWDSRLIVTGNEGTGIVFEDCISSVSVEKRNFSSNRIL